MNDNNLLNQTISDIFVTHNTSVAHSKHPQKARISKSQLELALAVILVDLASCDEHFDMPEYHMIASGLHRVFHTNKTDVGALIHRAKAAIGNLRGTSSFAQLLRDQLSISEREVIWEVIEDVIAADGVEDGFEIYLRNKYAGLLGITPPQKKPKPLESQVKSNINPDDLGI